MNDNKPLPWEIVPGEDPVIPPASHVMPAGGAEQARQEKSKTTPKNYPNELKLEVILEALKSNFSQNDLSKRYNISQAIISLWRKTAIEAIHANLEGAPNRGRKPNRNDAAFDHLLNAADIEWFERLRANLSDALAMVDLILRGAGNKAPGKADADHGHS